MHGSVCGGVACAERGSRIVSAEVWFVCVCVGGHIASEGGRCRVSVVGRRKGRCVGCC